MNTVYPRMSAHALRSALPRISAYPPFHNVKKAPSPTAPPPPLWISAHLFPHFLKWKEYKEKLFLLTCLNKQCFGLHVRKLEAAATFFKILLVEIRALKMFTGKLDLDCSSSLIAFETKLGFFPLLTRRFDFFKHVFCFCLFRFISILRSDVRHSVFSRFVISLNAMTFVRLFWRFARILLHPSNFALGSTFKGDWSFA